MSKNKWLITFENGATCSFIPFIGTESEAKKEESKMIEKGFQGTEVWAPEEYLNEIFRI